MPSTGNGIDESEHVDVWRVVRIVVVCVVAAVIVALAVDNRHDVRLGYVVGDADSPAWIVVVLAGVGGFVIGWLIKHRPRRS